MCSDFHTGAVRFASQKSWLVAAGGRLQPPIGSQVKGYRGSTGVKVARAELASTPIAASGSWESGDAGGELVLAFLEGALAEGDELRWVPDDGGAERPIARCSSTPAKAKHWLMFQDGGMPTELEPLLGVFRSPLLLRRNRYREGSSHDPIDSAEPGVPLTQGAAFAKLPVDSLTDFLANLSQGIGDSRPALVNRISLSARRQLGVEAWRTLPDQFRDGIEEWREHLLQSLAAAGEPLVAEFLKEAGQHAERELDLEPLLRRFPIGVSFDPTAIRRVQVGERALRLAIQLVWGSQVEMIRHGTQKFLDQTLLENNGLIKRLAELVQWALDYRVSDGHTSFILGMGRDTLPGRLSLASWDEPPAGSEIRGQQSGARRILLSAELRSGTSWSRGNAQGDLLVMKGGGELLPEETLVLADRDIGIVAAAETPIRDGGGGVFAKEVEVGTAREVALAPELARQQADLARLLSGVRRIEFKPDPEKTRDGPRLPPRPPLRADLPGPLAATEMAVQELLLRDIAEASKGELRTDPMWSFLRRRVTVHSQGGCPMAENEDQGFTDESGEVFGCKGLYVMDGAAFPISVGVNPSATIAAVAELKVERFLQSERGIDTGWLASERENATRWVNEKGRASLDPLNDRSRLRSPAGSPAPAHPGPKRRPIGIEFTEAMTGRAKASGSEVDVDTKLDIQIHDLWSFLERDRLGKPEPLLVTGGSMTIGRNPPPNIPGKLWVLAGRDRSYLRLRRDPTVGGRERRTLDYRLELAVEPPPARVDAQFVLLGRKIIRDDEGMDVWEDTTTLSFELRDQHGAKLLEQGALELEANKFFSEQLPKTRATGTDDLVRQAWALAAFGKFFFGHLVDVYLPELDRVVDAVKTVTRGSHV